MFLIFFSPLSCGSVYILQEKTDKSYFKPILGTFYLSVFFSPPFSSSVFLCKFNSLCLTIHPYEHPNITWLLRH